MIVDGRLIASEILASTRKRVEHLSRTPIVRAVTVAPAPETLSYLRIKALRASDAGMTLEVVHLPEDTSTEAVEEAVRAPGADAVIVQLPLPAQIDTARVVNAIPLSKDADVLSEDAYQQFVSGERDALLPPVVAALKDVLERSHIVVEGMSAVVVGQGKLVGLPASTWLSSQGADVTVLTKESESLAPLKPAGLVVSGAGSPHLITPDLLSPGVVLIDAGTSESGGQMLGDIDPSCAPLASVFTPVPGGMGPIAVACLFGNVCTLLERTLQEP